jgi:hypothetical protein
MLTNHNDTKKNKNNAKAQVSFSSFENSPELHIEPIYESNITLVKFVYYLKEDKEAS